MAAGLRNSRRCGMSRRALITAASLAAVFASTLLFSTGSALAYSRRTFEAKLPVGPAPAEQIAIDSANRIWATESIGGGFRLFEFNALNERLPNTIETGGRLEGSMAIDHSHNNYLYFPDSFDQQIRVYNTSGVELPEKTISKEGRLAIAFDNSSESTSGHLFVTRSPHEGEGEFNGVELFSETGKPINFSRTEESNPPAYLSGNRLTGTPAGSFPSGFRVPYPSALAVGPDGELFIVSSQHAIDEYKSSGEFLREITGAGAPGEFAPGSIAVDPTSGDLLAVDEHAVEEYSSSGVYLGEINGTEVPGAFEPAGIAVNSQGFLYVVNGTSVDIFSPTVVLPKVTYPGVSEGTETSATLNAEVNPDNGGEITSCEFEYVEESAYHPEAAKPFAEAHKTPCSQQLPISGTSPAAVSANISNIAPGVTYYYRLVVGNKSGTTEALPRTFDLRAPSISGVSAGNLTETTAELTANINPEGADTTYHFEYGPTTSYGSSAPVPAADIGSFDSLQSVSVHLTNLEKGAVYHFRLVAENAIGTTTGEDQTFNFFPPSCPNATLRQQSGTAFLPDCRAYELVSPGDAGGTVLFPEGPQSPLATQPSRFAFGGILGEIPEAGGEPPSERGDLYIATRSDTGWTSRYIGPPATQTLIADGPPNEDGYIQDVPSGVLTDSKMSQFLDWDDPYNGIATNSEPPISYAPYLRDSEGNFLGRLPTNLGTVPGGAQAGELLTGGVKASPEFNHYFFSSTAELSFAPGALTHEPGSAYDDNLEENTVTLISKLANGGAIEEGGGEFITFPGVSADGSHILMSTGYSCTYGCNPNYNYGANRHLFMRVNGGPTGVTYEIAPGHPVHYVGMNADGSKVYFTSAEKLTPEAEDTSTNLYMWSEQGELKGAPLTLISKPSGSSGTGNPVCPAANWTKECGVVPIVNVPSKFLSDSILNGGPGGNGLSDNSIAAENGDIYFISPQQLDGAQGILGQQNLYDYREGKIQYVTTFTTGPFCADSIDCSEGPLVRIQVSANDSHMAFLTASQITSYDNAGHLEMYTYDATSGNVHCVSCLPDGAPPTSDVEASDNGLFMTEDGRTFFSTADPLVPQDTDGIRDVYEYVDGRPQLISSGTSEREIGVAVVHPPGLDRAGLVGVSANGTDVYFSTFDTLVARDHNGNSALKFYDARTDGGFAEPPSSAPCAAADECAGPGSSPPAATPNGTGANLGSLGNFQNSSSVHHTKKPQKRHHRRKRQGRRARTDRGAGR